MRPKNTYRLLAAAIAVMMVMTIVPTAQAQNFPPTFTVKTPTLSQNILKPDLDIATLTVDWTFSFDQRGTELAALNRPTATIKWEPVSCDRTGVIVTGALTETFALPSAPATSVDGVSRFNVEVTQEAPGETSITCTVEGRVIAIFGGQIPDSEPGVAQFPVKAAFLGLLSVNVPATIKQAGPQKQIRYDLEVANLGNARTFVTYQLSEGATSGGWKPVLPTQITLESTQQGGQATSTNVAFLISTPFKNGWNNKETTLTLTVIPVSTKDPEAAGQPVPVNVLSRVRGVYVPTLEPMLLAGAVLATAFMARMMRRDEE